MRIPAALIAVSVALGATAAYAGDAATKVEKTYEEQQREALKSEQKADVKAGKVKTVQGQELTVTTMGGVKVDGANVVKADIVTDNGVIHVIDAVVLPK